MTQPAANLDTELHRAMNRILRVFPRRTSYTPTDSMAFVGDPPLECPQADEVHVSVTWTWDRREGERLATAWGQYYPVVKLGGPAYGDSGDTFTPGLYVAQGHVFTSRGCIRRCPWCLVHLRVPDMRLLPITGGWIVGDDNILATPREHQELVYAMLRRQRHAAEFRGGVDARLVTPWFADQLRTMRVARLFLACDSEAGLEPLRVAMEHLGWLGRNKLYCYVLVGFNRETIAQAAARLERVWQLGLLPFAQLYRPPTEERKQVWPTDWRQLARLWSRPAAMKVMHR